MNSGSTQVLNILFGIFLARLLSPADYGIIGILTIFTLIAGNLQSSGFTQALVNLKHPTDRDYNSVFWFNVLVSFALYVVLFFSAPLIAAFFHQPCLVWLSRFVFLAFFISSFGIVQNAYMTKNMMNKEIAIVSFVALISSNVVGVCLAFSGMAYWSLAWQQVIFYYGAQLWQILLHRLAPTAAYRLRTGEADVRLQREAAHHQYHQHCEQQCADLYLRSFLSY